MSALIKKYCTNTTFQDRYSCNVTCDVLIIFPFLLLFDRYGDRSPKSIHARVFAIVWILIGITIFSMLTAALTTAITSVVVQGPPSIYGLKVSHDIKIIINIW